MDTTAELNTFLEMANNYLDLMQGGESVENNKERPLIAGEYLTINSLGCYQKTYFDGVNWLIMPGQNPVAKWFKEKETVNQPTGANTEQ